LEALRDEYGESRKIEIVKGDANEELIRLLASGVDWKAHRAVVFLDPFGMQVDWTTIEALAKGIEVIVNFPLGMAIQRVLLRSGDVPVEWRATLDRVFGSSDWYQHTYKERADLFGATTHKLEDAGARLLKWYQTRLAGIFGHASSARLIRNTKGNPLYYLIWAGPHPKGLEIADYILTMGEKSSRH
jgi:three-Cys-motif partner protein